MADDHITTDDLRKRIDELEGYLADVAGALDELKADVDALPNGQKAGDVDEVLDVGRTYQVVIEDDGSGTKKGDPMGRIHGVATFIQNPNGSDLRPGDTVDVVVSKTGETHAKAVIPAGDGDD